MANHESNSVWTDSSANRIHRLEQRIIVRRQLINHQVRELRQDFRRILTAPATLLTAGGIGLATGLMLKRRSVATGSYTKTGKLTQIFANALKLIAMARALAAALPADSQKSTHLDKSGVHPDQ